MKSRKLMDVLAQYASEGLDVFLRTVTRGDVGRYRGFQPEGHQHRDWVGHRRWRQEYQAQFCKSFRTERSKFHGTLSD